MNVIFETTRAGFVENDWVGHVLEIGHAARIRVATPDTRCVMTTLAQADLPKDTDILRALTRYNRLQIGADGLFPCLGVYSVIEAPGLLRVNDRLTVA